MYERFNGVFVPDRAQGYGTAEAAPGFRDPRLDGLTALYGGMSFNDGIYRVISDGAIAGWNQRISSAFPAFSGRVCCFGIDWLGRVFALDAQRAPDEPGCVILFEPGTGEVLEITSGVHRFHEDELVEHREEALAEGFYRQWREHGGAIPGMNQCVGYKTPLFLGGSDTVDNLELSDLDVYWSLAAQLIRKTRGLPPGTRVGKIHIV